MGVTSQQPTANLKVNTHCKAVKSHINIKRNATWKWQRSIYTNKTHTDYKEKKVSCQSRPYLRWINKLWSRRADHLYKRYNQLNNNPKLAICYFFKSNCAKALSVAWCESKYHRYARNGQYMGIWQMGNFARDTYGHGDTPLEQTYYAYQYYKDEGWQPWSCA